MYRDIRTVNKRTQKSFHNTHGMTLAAVSMPYYRYILLYGTAKFARYAEVVWGVNPREKTETQVAYEGLENELKTCFQYSTDILFLQRPNIRRS